jgi:hypothetical protein
MNRCSSAIVPRGTITSRLEALRRPPKLLLLVTLVACSACLPNPHLEQTRALLAQLVSARTMLSAQPPQVDAACNMIGDVQTRLFGEPGLSSVQPAWQQLREAADALQAVCGQETLLEQPSTNSPARQAADRRWQQGSQHELGVACQRLQAAAAALGRPEPC